MAETITQINEMDLIQIADSSFERNRYEGIVLD
jgi:hypothetical protein